VRIHDIRDEPKSASDDWDFNIAAPRQEDVPPGQVLSRAIAKQLKVLAAQDQWLLWIETDRLAAPWSVSLDHFDPYAEDITAAEDGEAPQPWDEPPLGPVVLSDREFERLQATFASVVTEWDADLGRWIGLFRKHGLAESALWIVTSGHGLSLGEHDWIGPAGNGLYEELVHLPLILRLPEAEQAGRRVPELTASVDLLPTLGEAFGATLTAGVHGNSLLAPTQGSRKPNHSYLCQKLAGGKSALRTSDWAFLHAGERNGLLFRKPEDRWEVNDVTMQHLEWASHMKITLREFVEKAQDEPFTLPVLKDYDEVIQETHSEMENKREYGTTGE
jgi:arylsulfatase A-like enzyme